MEDQESVSYKTLSEYQPDFLSDNEPPEDKLIESRLILKKPDIRIYKQILKIGQEIHMPSRYDKVVYRLVETETESIDLRKLDGIEVVEAQLGKPKLMPGFSVIDEEVLNCIENLKFNETSHFKIEYVSYNEQKKRVLERERFFIIELQRFLTIIDLHGDLAWMKTVTKRGIGQRRFGRYDEVSFQARIYQIVEGQEREIRKFSVVESVLDSAYPSTLIDILTSAKQNEEFLVAAKYEQVLEEEKNEEFISLLEKDKEVFYEISVSSIVELTDLFGNGSVLKKITKVSYSTGSPDDNSRIYLDYKIFDKQGNLIHESTFGLSSLQGLPELAADPRRHPFDGGENMPKSFHQRV